MCIAMSVGELVSAYPVSPPSKITETVDFWWIILHCQSIHSSVERLTRSTLRRLVTDLSWVGLRAGSIYSDKPLVVLQQILHAVNHRYYK